MDKVLLTGPLGQGAETLVGALLDRAGDRRTIEAIVVTGDWAADEVCVARENARQHILSTCRVTVVLNEPPADANALREKLFAPLADLYLSPLLMHMDDLSLLPPDPVAFELKYGGRVLHGNGGILARIRDMREDEVPTAFAMELVLRAAPLLVRALSGMDTRTVRGRGRLAYECTEAVRMCADALLLLHHRLPISLREKRRAFSLLYMDETRALRHLDDALRYRTDPAALDQLDPEQYWTAVKDFVLETLLRHFNLFCCSSYTPADFPEACRFIAALYAHQGAGEDLRRCLESLCEAGSVRAAIESLKGFDASRVRFGLNLFYPLPALPYTVRA